MFIVEDSAFILVCPSARYGESHVYLEFTPLPEPQQDNCRQLHDCKRQVHAKIDKKRIGSHQNNLADGQKTKSATVDQIISDLWPLAISVALIK